MRVWPAFDQAAGQRDAPDARFQPALIALRAQAAVVPNPDLNANAGVLRDIDNCTTWLLFYRQAIHRTPPDTAWQQRSARHVDSCVRYHADMSQ